MATSAKLCIIAWWVLVLIAILIWYRNIGYDRVMAGIFFVLGIIHLVEYGCHSAMRPTAAGNLILVSLMILLIVITFGVYAYTRNIVALCVTCVAALLFIFVVFDIMFCSSIYDARVSGSNCFPSWSYNGGSMLGSMMFVFSICIVISWICMLYHTDFQDIGLYIIAAYTILTLIYVSIYYPYDAIGSAWCWFLTGLALIVWFVGLF